MHSTPPMGHHVQAALADPAEVDPAEADPTETAHDDEKASTAHTPPAQTETAPWTADTWYSAASAAAAAERTPAECTAERATDWDDGCMAVLGSGSRAGVGLLAVEVGGTKPTWGLGMPSGCSLLREELLRLVGRVVVAAVAVVVACTGDSWWACMAGTEQLWVELVEGGFVVLAS